MRVSLGGTLVVTATERWLSEVRAGRAFQHGGEQAGAAVNTSHLQLFNIVASPITVVGRLIIVSLAAVAAVNIAQFNTALTTLIGAGVNLLAGGAAGSGQVRGENNAAELGTAFGTVRLAAGTPVQITQEWTIELGAGEGVLVRPNLQNTSIAGIFQWIEV